MAKPIRDLTGQKIGKWLVIKRDTTLYETKDKRKRTRWWCKCECGKEISIVASNLFKIAGCLDCKNHRMRKPYSCRIWFQIKYRAKRDKIKFTIKKDFIFELLEKQNFKCALSGKDIRLAETEEGHKHGESTASLDRINNSKGYVPNNVQWVHKKVQFMKHAMNEEEFLEFCKAVIETREKRKL